MRKLLLILMLFAAYNLKAQVANYTFSTSLGSYQEITGGTVLGNTTTDDQRFVDVASPLGSTSVLTGVGLPIGFNFTYNGDVFDVFAINANGWISLGQSSQSPAVNINSSSGYTAISATSTAPAVLQNRIAAFARDLNSQTNGELRFETIGTAPNRILVVQWKNYRKYNATGDSYNFQIQLHETTNIVQLVYGTMTNNATAATPQIGLRGQANTDYSNRTTTTDWAATTAGTINTATVTLSATVFPVSGRIFQWAPPVVYSYDAGLTAINTPSTPVNPGSNNVSVTVKNFASIALTAADIAWKVNGVLQTPFSYTHAGLAQNASDGPVVIGSYTFTTPGFYTIKAWTENPNGNADENNANDTITKVVYVQGYAAIPFVEDFDNTWIDKLNTRDVPSGFWSNTPVTGNQSWRRDDDGAAALWTSPTTAGYSPAGANSTAHSAKFHTYYAPSGTSGTMDLFLDFTAAGTKVLKFWYINPSGTDSLSVFISDDGGANFTFIQKYLVSASWSEKSITLGTSVSPTTIIRFKATSDYGADDLGIDKVQVKLLQANDIAAVKWVSPLTGCGLTASEPVTVKFTNLGTAPQTNVALAYSINGGVTIVGPEFYTATTVNPGDTITYTFTQTANFSAPEQYDCGFVSTLLNDGDNTNDTVFMNISNTGIINSFPFTENFEAGHSNYLLLSANADAGIMIKPIIGNQNSAGVHFEGKTSTGWAGTGTISAANAWGVYTTHHAKIATCGVNATGVTALKMKLDLRQTYSYNPSYNWFAVIVNGTDTLTDEAGTKYFHPVTSTSDAYATKTFDLTSYAGTSFSLEFKSSCKYDNTNGSSGAGDNVYFDNLSIYQPSDIDAGVTALLSPVDALCGNATQDVNVIITNFGINALTNIDVTAHINTPSGILNLTGVYAGPLAGGESDTILLGNINTIAAGDYHFAVYTSVVGDTIPANDTLHEMVTIKAALAIPHLENFQSGATALANWTTNFLSGTGHATTSNVMFRNLWSSAATGTALFNEKIGLVSPTSYLSFDYGITDYTGGGATTLALDSIFMLLSNDCGDSYYTVHLITAANHTPSTSMQHVVVPIGVFSGENVIPAIFAKWNAGDYYLDFDNIAISNAPVVNLGADFDICSGTSATLNAGASALGYTYTYSWSTLLHPATIATSQSITVDSAATYIVVVENGYGVTDSDTIVITVNPSPSVSLGADTYGCASYLIDAGTGFLSYSWSNGAATQATTVTATGDYWVEVENNFGCTVRDTIHITIIPLPTVNAGTDQSLCVFDPFTTMLATAADYDSLLWTTSGDGHFNDSTLLQTTYYAGTLDASNGSVTLTLTAYALCDTVTSEIVLTFTTSVTADAGSNVTICEGSSTNLVATGGTSYAWAPSTGLSAVNIANPVANPATTTTYTVTVTSACGSATDEVTVTVDPLPVVNLGPDSTVCAGNFIVLDAGSGFDSYLWSTSAISQTISVDTLGIGLGTFTYSVVVTNGACQVSDDVAITFDICSDITENVSGAVLQLMPNPNNGTFMLYSNGINGKSQIEVYSIHGQLIYSEQVDFTANFARQFNLTAITKGVYFVKISNTNVNVVERLVIE